MSIEITPKDAVDMSSWWKRMTASQLCVFAWVDENFKSPVIQRVVEWEGNKDLDSCSDYWYAVNEVREKAGGVYIDCSSQHMTAVSDLAKYICLKADSDKATMAAIKRDRIAKLKQELEALEGGKYGAKERP